MTQRDLTPSTIVRTCLVCEGSKQIPSFELIKIPQLRSKKEEEVDTWYEGLCKNCSTEWFNACHAPVIAKWTRRNAMRKGPRIKLFREARAEQIRAQHMAEIPAVVARFKAAWAREEALNRGHAVAQANAQAIESAYARARVRFSAMHTRTSAGDSTQIPNLLRQDIFLEDRLFPERRRFWETIPQFNRGTNYYREEVRNKEIV